MSADDPPLFPGQHLGAPGDAGAVEAAATSTAASLAPDQQLRLLDILFDHMPVAIVVVDRHGRLCRWNSAFQTTTEGCLAAPPRAAASHPRFLDLYPGNEDAFRPLIAQALSGATVSRQALRLTIRDAVRYAHFVGAPLVERGEIVGAVLVGIDVTDSELARRTLEQRVQERTREVERARDLHDAVTQTLFSASLIADVLPRLWERGPAEGRRCLDDLRRLTRGALAEMRALLAANREQP